MKKIALFLTLLVCSIKLMGQTSFICQPKSQSPFVYYTSTCVTSNYYNSDSSQWNSVNMNGAYIIVGTDTFLWISGGKYRKKGSSSCDTAGSLLTNNFSFRFEDSSKNILECDHGTILPVNLINFSSNCDNSITNIQWQTASEQNSSHFEIERSFDGYNWTNLGKILSNGNTYQISSYNFIDKTSSGKLNYYRIKMVDKDDYKEYTNIINSFCYDNNTKNKIEIYPNPIINEINIKSSKLLGEIEIKSIDGKTIVKTNSNKMEININMSEYDSGIYFIKIQNDNFKIIK